MNSGWLPPDMTLWLIMSTFPPPLTWITLPAFGGTHQGRCSSF